MKKITLILMAAMLMMTAGSCKKDKTDVNGNGNGTTTTNDGVFNPSQKISKYYYWNEYDEEKILEQVWNWDGKQLSSIDYTDWEGTVYNTEYFTYEHNRLSKVVDLYERYEFKYADGKLKKVTNYYNDELRAEYTISYGSNNKISMMEGVYYEGKKAAKERFNPLSLILPEQMMGRLDRNSVQKEDKWSSKESYTETFTITLTWDGDNVSKAEYNGEFVEGDGYGNYTEMNSYQYDNKHNPKYGFMNRYFPDIEGFGSNNIIKCIYSGREEYYENGALVEEEDESGEYRITYQYDESNYPTMYEVSRYYDGSYSYSYKYFYEYK